MQFKSLIFAPLVASGLVAAAPSASTAFEVVAVAPGSGAHLEALQASQGGFRFKLADEKAKCSSKSDNTVTLQVVDGELHLYKSGGATQRAFVDRSGMGQGVMGYSTGDSLPRNGERKGFKVDASGNLTFNGKNFITCPGAPDNSWSVWVDAGIANPGFNKDCKPFTAFTIKTSKPNSCTYSSSS